MDSGDFERQISTILDGRAADNLLRPSRFSPVDSTHVEHAGRVLTNFAGNDYLGLSTHPAIRDAVVRASEARSSASASGLITGYTPVHAVAERKLAEWKHSQAAVLLPSGYQANHSAIQTLAAIGASYSGGVRFLLDKLAHASLIDAVRATGESFRVFPHNGISKLRRLLDESPADQLQVVVTESIFSMDGDAADLAAIADLKRDHPFVLLLDEAHGTGVYGHSGEGYASELGLEGIVDVSIVTFSKALGAIGGAVCGSKLFCDALINFGRAYIYSTSVPESQAAAVSAAIEVCRSEPGRRERVRDLARRFRGLCRAEGLVISEGDSPIVPVILGEAEYAVGASKRLEEAGLLVIAVRPPTVPRGSSRLRVTLSCNHTDEEVDRLARSLL